MSEVTTGEKDETQAPIPDADLNLDSLDDLSGGGVTVTADSVREEVLGLA